MTTKQLNRWSGLLAMVAGIASMFFNLAVPLGLIPASIEPPRGLITLTLTIFAVIGIYAYQSSHAGILGLIGFIVAEIGLLLNFALRFLFTFVAPTLMQFPDALAAIDRSPYNSAFLATLVIFAVGYVLFGAATMRARMLPRWAGALLIVGAILSFVLMGLSVNVGALLANAGFIWMGYTMWTSERRASTALQAAPAT